MVDTTQILMNYLMETYTCGEVTLSNEIQIKQDCKHLIAHRYEDGTIKVRTQEYNERCVDKW